MGSPSCDSVTCRRRAGPRSLAALFVGMIAIALVGCTLPTPVPSTTASPTQPNIVFVLVDDLSSNLTPYMTQVQKLEDDGMSFTQYSVTDSLCCPSRSSILTGQYPHNTGVFDNTGDDGGFDAFRRFGNEERTFATALQSAGYRTGFMGKYLNGYQPADPLGGTSPYVPPGWDEWVGAGNGYPEFDYSLNENHRIVSYGSRREDYLTNVLSAKGTAFISESAAGDRPFFLEISTFAPHAPYVPDPADRDAFPGLTAPRSRSFDTLPATAPPWLADTPPLSPMMQRRIDRDFRKRAQSVQAVDRMLGDLRSALQSSGEASNTVVIFSSDNGYHMGEHRLAPGKMTAFDTDVRVPLVIAGPGIASGATQDAVVQNVDLAPTFEVLAGAMVPDTVDGRNLTPLFDGSVPSTWRTTALVEHHGPNLDDMDPDRPARGSGNPPTYTSIRAKDFTWVEYADGVIEFYDRRADPDELANVADSLTPESVATLRLARAGLGACAASTCRETDRVDLSGILPSG